MFLISRNHPWLLSAVLPVAAILLVGCGKKPPGCADAETVQTIQSMLVDNVKAIMPMFSGSPTVYQDDPTKIQEGYYQALKTTVVNVVNDGYNDQAKKNSCRANLSVSTESGGSFSRDIVYSTQRTEDKNSTFVVEVEAFQPFVLGVAGDFATFYSAKRYGGEWTGSYSCGGIDGATTGPQGPFSMPVTMVVDEHARPQLERTTQGGGVEILAGSIGRKLKLVGEGKNSPDDTWRTVFEGEVKGMTLTADGEIQMPPPETRVLRACKLDLQRAAR